MVCLDTNSLIRFFTNDDPQKAQAVKKLLEKDIKEALLALESAAENAKRQGSEGAIVYVEECVKELQGISASLGEVESLKETRERILQIKSDADEIAAAAVYMACLPPHINVLELIQLPREQMYLGRG